MKSKNNIPATVLILLIIVFTQFANPKSVLASRICGLSNSNIYYVDVDSIFGSPDGCNWGTAYKTLQDALLDPTLASGDEIWVAEGTYYPDEGAGQINNDRNSIFLLINGVDVYGGFTGTESLLSERNPALHITILSGDIGTTGVNIDNSYHVIGAVNIISATNLSGFTIRDGNANGGNNFGGGIQITNSNNNFQLTELKFTDNYAGNGGGVATFYSSPVLTRVVIRNNIASQYGGGFYNQDGSPTLIDVIFDNNQTQQTTSPGGGMHSTNSNSAIYTVAPSLTNVTFSNNKALQGGGGGLFNRESNSILTNVTFSGNSASVRGGAVLNEGSNPVFNNVTFSGNTAPAGTGGAMRNIFAGAVSSNPIIRNTILWGNGSEEIINDAGNTVTITDSVVQGATADITNNIINTNPILSPLAPSTGFTDTMAIGLGSSALDAGGTKSACALTDQRGVTRPQGSACDIGAFELGGTATTTTAGNASATYGDISVNLTATISPNPGGGTVQFYIDGNPVGAPQSVTAGAAILAYNPNALNAGPHTIRADYSGLGSFLSSSSNPANNGTLTITQRAASVTPNNATKVYGDLDPAPLTTGTLTGFLPADNVTATYSRTAGETVAGGPYTISATLSPAGVLGNYNITYNTANFTITQRAASVTPNDASKVYGALDPAPLTTGTLTGFLPADNVTATYSRTAGETVAGGPYTISATLSPAGVLGNYNITYNTANFTITQRAASVTPNDASKVYGALDPAPLTTGTLTGFLPADNVTATYSRTAGETVAGGPYTISATLSPAGVLGNYNITYNTANFTITQRAASVTPNDASKVYGALDPAPLTIGTLTGFLPADNVTATYSRIAGETVAGGPYTISATLSPAGVLGNYNITYNTANFTITQRAASVTPNDASKVYGDLDPAPLTTGTITGFLPADNVTASYSRTAGETVAGGPYTISATLSPAGVLANYNITYNTANFTITQRAASVTPNDASKVYGALDPAPLTTGTLTGFLPADNVTATYSRIAGETVAGGPYTISATLSPAGVLGNYNITYNTANFTITQRAASVTPNDASKVYGALDPAPLTTGTLTGFLPADNVTATYSRIAGETVAGGPYTISATLSPAGVLGNYNITYNTANFTITQRAASVTPNDASKVYGALDPAPLTTGTLTGFLPADNVTATYSRIAGETVAGGPYTISATLSPAGVLGNYNITYNTANFTISLRAASVTPNNASKVYGDLDPAPLTTGTLTGFLPADNVTATYSRIAGETVAGGSYTISATLSPAGVLGNYNITYNTANFTITQRAASVTPNDASKVYGALDPAPLTTGTLTGFLPADNVTATYSRIAGETVAGGPYTISATLSPAGVLGNYNITYNTANFTITQRAASVTPNDASKVYGALDPAPLTTGTLTGFLPADNVTATYSRIAGETVAGGPYTISATLSPAGVLGNYNITYNTANFTITRITVISSIIASDKTYDGTTTAAFTCSLTGVIGTDDVTCTGGTATFDTRNFGTGKTVTATGLGLSGTTAGNYSLSSTTATDTADISKLAITVTAVSDTKAFDGNTSSTGLPTASGPLGSGDSAIWTQTFDTALVGTNKTLTPAGTVSDGNSGNNYAITFTPVNTGTITGALLNVAINQAGGQLDPTNSSPINFTVVFSASVSNFATGDVTLSGSAVGLPTTAIVTGSGTTYNVAVSGMVGDGTVTASIAGGVASDISGNLNSASTSADDTVTYDTTRPTVTINQAGGQLDPTNASPINFTVVFSEPVAGFTTGDVIFTGSTAGGTLVGTVTGGPANYNVAVSGMTSNGTVTASVPAGRAADGAGNTNFASTSTDNTVTYDTTGPTVAIGAPTPALTIAGPVDFAVTITGGTTFTLASGNVTLNTIGTAAATTITITNGNTANPTVTVSGVSGNGTISISIAAGIASDALGNPSPASGPSAAFTVDNAGPVVLFNANTVPTDGATVSGGPTQLRVAYNEDVKNDGSAGAANNIVNYLLVESGPNLALDTATCLGVQTDDVQITINTATYTNNGGIGPFVATLGINGGTPLPVGTYHLFVCGTTSIEDLTNNELNNGLTDTIIDFTVVQASAIIPKTGFPMNTVTNLPIQPADKAYASTDLWIEIPNLGVKMPIVGVPKTSTGWDVTWLDRKAGWLDGSAYPTWDGNSVITAHVWDALNKPGPFARLKELKYGDQVKIHAFGQVYTYEIRETTTISPTNTTAMLKHQDKPWITLITCEDYKELTQTYSYRRMVRAVLVSVTAEK